MKSPNKAKEETFAKQSFHAAEYWPLRVTIMPFSWKDKNLRFGCESAGAVQNMLAWFLLQPSKEESEDFLTALMHSMAPCARMTLTIICSGMYIFTIDMWTISCLYYEACRLKEKGTVCCRCFRNLPYSVTLYLAFYVAASHVLSGICFDVLCGILSAILSRAYFTIVFGILLDACVDSFAFFFDKLIGINQTPTVPCHLHIHMHVLHSCQFIHVHFQSVQSVANSCISNFSCRCFNSYMYSCESDVSEAFWHSGNHGSGAQWSSGFELLVRAPGD